VLNAVNRALKSPKWIFQRAYSPLPVTHTLENIEFQTGNDFLGLEPAGCEYQKLFTASISEVEKIQILVQPQPKGLYSDGILSVYSEWFFSEHSRPRDHALIFSSQQWTTPECECPKRRGPRFIPLGRWMKFIFLQRRETFFLHASIERPRAVAAADGRS
jgi:hypothetical protein